MPRSFRSWLERYVSRLLKQYGIPEEWITDVEIRQKNSGEPKEVVLLLADIGPNSSPKVLRIAVPEKSS